MTTFNLNDLLHAYAEAWESYASKATLLATETNRFYRERVRALESVLINEFGFTRIGLGQLNLAADSKNPNKEAVEYQISQLLHEAYAEAV